MRSESQIWAMFLSISFTIQSGRMAAIVLNLPDVRADLAYIWKTMQENTI